ncbi:hypothetical protein ANO11243_042150 [Dothideomycetidae sp. 11243]|nr:hypothetical protein ANO11243_042150 [fungal sp. No.11243]
MDGIMKEYRLLERDLGEDEDEDCDIEEVDPQHSPSTPLSGLLGYSFAAPGYSYVILCCAVSSVIILAWVFGHVNEKLMNISTAMKRQPQNEQSTLSAVQMLEKMPWNPSMMRDIHVDSSFSSPLYPTRLGKDVLVLDIDTRPWHAEAPANMSRMTWGRLNHYVYAHLHGYDYKFINPPNPPKDTNPTWAKVTALRAVLDDPQTSAKFIVFVDSDVVFPHLKMPIEYLLDHWNITSDIAVAMPQTPEGGKRYDRVHRRRTLNSGFIITQNIPSARAIYRDWSECVSEVKYDGCAHWKRIAAHEQGAFADYVRYDYPEAIREIPCDEANGSPNYSTKLKCGGKLIAHYYREKNNVRAAVQASIADLVLPTIAEDMMEEWTIEPGL